MTSDQDLFDGFPRGVFEAGAGGRTLEQQAMPRAGFLRADAVRRSRLLAYDPEKLFLGVIDGRAKPSARLGHTEIHDGQPIGFGDDTHAMTIAGNRSGKGRSSIVPTLLGYAGSTLTTDVKGELATITATRRVALGQKVFIADPFDTVKGPARNFRARFNPMSVLKPGSPTLIEDAG